MTTTGVKLSARLPRGAMNGLAGAVAKELAASPGGRRLAVSILDVEEVRENFLSESETVVLRVRRIEVILDPEDLRTVQEIVLRAHTERSGQTVLPFETDEQAQKYFEEWASAPEPGPKDNDVSWDTAGQTWDGNQAPYEGPPGLRTGAPDPDDDVDSNPVDQEDPPRENPLFKDGKK